MADSAKTRIENLGEQPDPDRHGPTDGDAAQPSNEELQRSLEDLDLDDPVNKRNRAPDEGRWAPLEPIHNLDTAARRCGVSRLTVRMWIDRGMRAFPLGAEGRYDARDYLIRETWLIEFLEANAIRRNRDADDEKSSVRKKAKRARRPANPHPDHQPLGPCPV